MHAAAGNGVWDAVLASEKAQLKQAIQLATDKLGKAVGDRIRLGGLTMGAKYVYVWCSTRGLRVNQALLPFVLRCHVVVLLC